MMRDLGSRCARVSALLVTLIAGAMLAGCERPPVDTVQRGYRGTGMEQVYNPRTVAVMAPTNELPADTPMVPPGGPAASAVFKNVKVVGDLGVGEFTRLMVSMTAWVSPDQGCTYCHTAGEDFSTDTLYTKVVARRMLQMTRHINADWKPHVAETGVTCYTCHRGQPVPPNVWFKPAEQKQAAGMVGNNAGQNSPARSVAYTALPYDPFTPFLTTPNGQTNDVRVIGLTALPTGNRQSVKQTEYTYGLMMHMSQALGVNCTYCHNTRSFAEWDASSPQRAIGWYGIRMTRDINTQYLDSLTGIFPENRRGPTGDAPKVNCATCHQGAYKPMYGASLLKTHPELVGVRAAVEPADASASPQASSNVVVLFFAVGSSSLTSDAGKGLSLLIVALRADPAAKVTISGYHSAAGDLAQNQELAKQRAFAVRDALKAEGIPDDRVVLEKPQSAEANLAGEDPKARRVEVAVK
jgi:photosynthetic reaction center cytochrome c subunit